MREEIEQGQRIVDTCVAIEDKGDSNHPMTLVDGRNGPGESLPDLSPVLVSPRLVRSEIL